MSIFASWAWQSFLGPPRTFLWTSERCADFFPLCISCVLFCLPTFWQGRARGLRSPPAPSFSRGRNRHVFPALHPAFVFKTCCRASSCGCCSGKSKSLKTFLSQPLDKYYNLAVFWFTFLLSILHIQCKCLSKLLILNVQNSWVKIFRHIMGLRQTEKQNKSLELFAFSFTASRIPSGHNTKPWKLELYFCLSPPFNKKRVLFNHLPRRMDTFKYGIKYCEIFGSNCKSWCCQFNHSDIFRLKSKCRKQK